jgi:hypothetical protein
VGYQRKSAAGVGLCLTRAGELLRFSRRSPSRPHPPRGRYVKLAGPPDPDSQREPGSRKSRLTPQLACRSVEPHNQADQSPKAPTTHTANSATAIGAALACFTPMKRRKLRTGRTRQHRQPWTAPRWRCRACRGSRWSARVPPARPKGPHRRVRQSSSISQYRRSARQRHPQEKSHEHSTTTLLGSTLRQCFTHRHCQ